MSNLETFINVLEDIKTLKIQNNKMKKALETIAARGTNVGPLAAGEFIRIAKEALKE